MPVAVLLQPAIASKRPLRQVVPLHYPNLLLLVADVVCYAMTCHPAPTNPCMPPAQVPNVWLADLATLIGSVIVSAGCAAVAAATTTAASATEASKPGTADTENRDPNSQPPAVAGSGAAAAEPAPRKAARATRGGGKQAEGGAGPGAAATAVAGDQGKALVQLAGPAAAALAGLLAQLVCAGKVRGVAMPEIHTRDMGFGKGSTGFALHPRRCCAWQTGQRLCAGMIACVMQGVRARGRQHLLCLCLCALRSCCARPGAEDQKRPC